MAAVVMMLTLFAFLGVPMQPEYLAFDHNGLLSVLVFFAIPSALVLVLLLVFF